MDFLLCSLVVLGELIGVIIGAMLIQLISYQIFGINIYQNIIKTSKKLDKYLTNLFE